MYLPPKRRILRLAFRYPRFIRHLAARKMAFARRYRWVERNPEQDDKVPRPLAFKLYLTLKCNARCSMCMLWGKEGILLQQGGTSGRFDEFDIVLLERVLQETGRFHPSFILSGGEPLLHPRFGEIGDLLRSHRCFAYVCTNGLLLDRFLTTLTGNPYLVLYVSLDGLEKENDRLRGAGGFKRVTENVRALKAQKGAPYVGIQFTLQPENVGVLYETCREAVSLGADWFLINLRWYLSAEQARRYEQVMQREFNITPTSHLGFLASYDLDTEAFLDQCRRILNDEWPIQISSYLVKPEDIHTYVKSPETHPYDGMCCKQWVRMDVLPNGDVTPCIQYPDMVFGNLHDRGVSELWNCQEFARFRRFIRQQSLPVCSKCYPSYLYDAGRRYL